MSDPSDILQADALEALLTPGGEMTTHTLPAAEAALAATLAGLAGEITAGADFVSALEGQLRGRARASMPTLATYRLRVAAWGERAAEWLGGSMRRRALVALAIVILLLSLVFAVPPARAALLRVFRLGNVTIFPAAPSVTSVSQVPTPIGSVLDLAGETTLAGARQQVKLPIRLPTYPADLGPPQRVFVQDLGGAAVILVWLEPGRPDQVRMSLHELSSDIWVQKFGATVVEETTVHGQRALWTEGPYQVQVIAGGQVSYETRRLVTGHVLIWTEGGITYRLETSASLADAVRIAESLR